jgi:uncharacterized YigZ family protein
MKKDSDLYKTLSKVSNELLFKEKNSKFYGQAFPVTTESDIKTFLEKVKSKHPQSNHVCYAWQLGVDVFRYIANDDGEPSNSAGMPIHGQIQSFEITNVLITVTRYFGGTKLGVGGLISAYRTTAKMTLQTSSIIEKRVKIDVQLNFPYTEINTVMRIIKKHRLPIKNQKMELDCQIVLSIAKSSLKNILPLFDTLQRVQTKVV